MAYTDTTRKNTAAGGGIGSIAVTLASTVAGNLVVVGSSFYNSSSSAPVSVASDAGNTWFNAFSGVGSSGTVRQEAALNYSILTTGGSRTITVDPGINTYDGWIACHEFSSGGTKSLSGAPVTNTGTTQTTSDTTAMTPANNDVLVVAFDGHTASGTTTENVSPGDSGFTLSNENESGSSAEPGSMVFKIISGAPGTPRAAWTIVSGSCWAAGIAAFKDVPLPPGPVTAPSIGMHMTWW